MLKFEDHENGQYDCRVGHLRVRVAPNVSSPERYDWLISVIGVGQHEDDAVIAFQPRQSLEFAKFSATMAVKKLIADMVKDL